jgi:apolipoprotein D and lipocalin family protein
MKRLTLGVALVMAAFGLGCTGVPKGLQPVTGFEPERYMGKWYEIARLDHRFERGLTDVSATYMLRDDGAVTVVNRGYDPEDAEWDDVEGVARFRGDPSVASLKVTFFWPFYGGYHVIALDREGYGWAMVAGPSRGYLWILSRTGQLAPAVLDRLVQQAADWGFATDDLIFVDQTRPDG